MRDFRYVSEGILKMPKQKTHKGLTKRFKITASGKVSHKCAGGGHLMSGKNAKRRRRTASSALISGKAAKMTKIHLYK